MPYIPLNRVQTNLFAFLNEFVYLASGADYSGDYHKLYTGKTYTGATPNTPFSEEIIPKALFNSYQDEFLFEGRTVQIAQQFQDPDVQVPYKETAYFPQLIDEYVQLQGLRPEQTANALKILAQSIKPTEKDYQKGQFFRFFVKKRNEPVYTEIDRELFRLIKNRDPKIYSKYHLPFRLLWTLTGKKDDVFEANKNITYRAERELKLVFLPEFLQQNWLKFYRES